MNGFPPTPGVLFADCLSIYVCLERSQKKTTETPIISASFFRETPSAGVAAVSTRRLFFFATRRSRDAATPLARAHRTTARTAIPEGGHQTRVPSERSSRSSRRVHEPPSPLESRNLRPRFGTMPAGRETRKRKAPAAPRPVLTIEVIDGPTKGQKFTKQVRPGRYGRRARAHEPTPSPPSPARLAPRPASLSDLRCRGLSLRKFPSVFPFQRAFRKALVRVKDAV